MLNFRPPSFDKDDLRVIKILVKVVWFAAVSAGRYIKNGGVEFAPVAKAADQAGQSVSEMLSEIDD